MQHVGWEGRASQSPAWICSTSVLCFNAYALLLCIPGRRHHINDLPPHVEYLKGLTALAIRGHPVTAFNPGPYLTGVLLGAVHTAGMLVFLASYDTV